MKIVADKDIPFLQGVFEPYAEVVYLGGRRIGAADLRDADALIVRTRTRCDEALLAGSGVKIVATATIGRDHIDVDWCVRHGITVADAAGCNARGVLQWVGAALAGASRKYGWQPQGMCLGVVGVGNVGSLIAEYGKMWGFRVVCCDPLREEREGAGWAARYGTTATLRQVASTADIISFHVPLTTDGDYPTLSMASAEFFDALKPGALVLNSSRGEVLDEGAFLRAIRDKGVTAGIDTWRDEPRINRELLTAALFATTHIAGYSVQGKAMGSAMAIRAVAEKFGLEGVKLPRVDRHPRAISWEEMGATVGDYIDLEALTRQLKGSPMEFEAIRTGYRYREEYF